MLYILKKYLKVKAEKDYAIFSIRNLIVCIWMGLLFYMQGSKGQLPLLNVSISVVFSIILMIFSCDCITNKLYTSVNQEITKEDNFYKKIIASNIAVFLKNIFYFIILLCIVDVYFLGFIQGLKLIGQVMILIILSLGLGNFIFIFRSKFSSKTKKDVTSVIISMILGLGLNYLYYKVGVIVLLLGSLVIYFLSLVFNEKENSINS